MRAYGRPPPPRAPDVADILGWGLPSRAGGRAYGSSRLRRAVRRAFARSARQAALRTIREEKRAEAIYDWPDVDPPEKEDDYLSAPFV